MLLAIMLQVTPIVAPPAPVLVTSARRTAFADEGAASTGYPVSMEVRGGGAVLYRGTVRIAPNAQSMVRQTQSEPAVRTCGAVQGYRPSMETGLTLTFQSANYGASEGRVRVTVRWVRAGADACPTTDLTRAVELNAVVDLSGGAVGLDGDGGLSVRLKREG